MKLYIYILLLVLLIIYINRQTDYLENVSPNDFDESNYDETNTYNILTQPDKIKPVLSDSSSNLVPGFNLNDSSIYSTKYWTVKSKGFSDIYNYEDVGGEIVTDIANNMDSISSIDMPQPSNKTKNQPQSLDEAELKSLDEAELKTLDEAELKTSDETVLKSSDETKSKLPNEINYQKNIYKLLGTASNPYYNHYFYIFENLVDQKIEGPLIEEELGYIKNNRIYQYILVKMHNAQPNIIHWIGPRNKINIGDQTYFSLGTFQLGPLVIKKSI